MRRVVTWCFVVALVGPLLAGCASRPGDDALTAIPEHVPGVKEHVILVASSRARDPRPGVFYSGERTPALSFARVEITVPPTHKPGMVEYPDRGAANPATDMTVREALYRDTEKEFLSDLKAELSRRPPGQKQAVIFVHGYNTLFSEALYRITQLAEDSKSPSVPVLFTWASRGGVSDYVYDNNSATSARDRLEETIRLVFDSGAEKVTIFAHSMGNWVAVEALRQIQISGKRPPPEKFGNVILAAPDIDVDVFKSQLKRFGKPTRPFIVIVSRDDKALAFSDFIAGDKPRLGAYTNDAELVELGAVVVDMSNVKSQDGFNHGKFAQLAEMAPELRGLIARAQGSGPSAGNVEVAGIRFSGVDRLKPGQIGSDLPAVAADPTVDTGAPVVAAGVTPLH
ncbi:alpha/beta hydrolase [Ancylobacter sp. TS-1]|uniref:alpha/beta hydrolase n=1 Tax=Ancylobacter sp. TS-1 TaxID=1850374 RepID=UPI001265C043|nr:alpha/beta hydrolase [Ancylobacter sp. TS-1]QFR33127.1 alpha/beta fold hydrolase [Ancylobacter sp. TS-1]